MSGQGVAKPPLIPQSINAADAFIDVLEVESLKIVNGGSIETTNLIATGYVLGGTSVLPVGLVNGVSDGTFRTTAGVVQGATITSTTNNVAANSLKTSGAVVDVAASAPPVVGNVLVATSATTATWQTPSAFAPAAPVDSVQFNNAGAFGGNAGLLVTGAGTGVTATGTVAANVLSSTTTVTGGTGVTATTGNVVATAGNVVATAGSVSAGTTVTAGTGVTATTGNVVATAGSVTSASGATLGSAAASVINIGVADSTIGLYGTAAVVQPDTSVVAGPFVAGVGIAVNDVSTFDGYTIGQIVAALRSMGILN